MYMYNLHIHVLLYIPSVIDVMWHHSLPLQRVHSARVYTQSLELYRNKGWALAEVRNTYCTALHPYMYMYVYYTAIKNVDTMY